MSLTDHRSLSAYTLLLLLLVPSGAWSEQVHPTSDSLLIPDGTPVKLQMARTISSAHTQKNDHLDFIVVKDVTVGGFTVIPAGTIASGSVVAVKNKRLLGIGGNVIIKIDSVKLATGNEVALRASKEIKGRCRTTFMMIEMLTAALFYLPAAPLFLLSRGRDSTVLKGTEVTAYINGNAPVQTAKLLVARQNDSELPDMINLLPSRAIDGQGREGDMLNLVFVAKQNDLEEVFKRRGWVKTDNSKPTILWHLLRQRNHYTRLPMATLYVFGRPQTYSFALPDPASIVTRRHHLRIWKTDYKENGVPIWVGAATHDVSIQIVLKKLRITHRIDPQVDAERDFIAGNIGSDIHLVTREEFLDCIHPVFSGQTATGSSYYSDSKMLLLQLHETTIVTPHLHLETSALTDKNDDSATRTNANR